MKKGVYQESLVSKAVDAYRNQGLAAVGQRGAAKFTNFFFRSNEAVWFYRELVCLPLSEEGKPRDAQVLGSFSPVVPEELAQWLKERKDLAWAGDSRELEIASRLRHPWTCWKLGREIVAFCKVGGGQVFIVDFERVLSLPEKLAFMSDVYVLPHARKQGIARELLLATMNSLREHSFSIVSCHIPAGNRASTRLFSSLGFRPFHKIRFTRILGVQIFSTKPEEVLRKMTDTETVPPRVYEAGDPSGS
jgi:ribosomal protein S18 acetylase RimI-like enzyme